MDYSYCFRYPATACGTTGGTPTDLVTQMTDAYAGDTTRYTYDQAGHLAIAAVTGANPRTDQYGYDQAGNRTSEQVNGGTIITSTFNTGNQLTLRGSQTATYDLAGNRVSAQNGQASPHNARGQASSLWDTSVTLGASYSGPGMGSRTQLGTVAYYNDTLGVAAETDGATTTAYTRTPGGRVIGQRTPGGNYYLLGDRQDSVTRVIGPDGTSRINWTYNPYGIRTASTGPGGVTVRWGYHGGYHDPTGHVKMGERYYTPYTGSFIEVEPLKNPEQLHGLIDYTYAAGDPVNYSDPSGLFFRESLEGVGIVKRRARNGQKQFVAGVGEGVRTYLVARTQQTPIRYIEGCAVYAVIGVALAAPTGGGAVGGAILGCAGGAYGKTP